MITFPSPLIEGRLIKRRNRFLADVELSTGEIVTAHCPNTGSMKTCGGPGDLVYLLHSPSPTRKLAYTWELTKTPFGYVGVNTMRPNQLVAAAVRAGQIPELKGYETVRPEVAYGQGSRIDLLLEAPGKPRCYVEIKNTTLLVGDQVQFPDAVTKRGLKHLHELVQVVKAGDRAVMLFLVNRAEGMVFAPASAIDPDYSQALSFAAAHGVQVLAYRAEHSHLGIKLTSSVAVRLS